MNKELLELRSEHAATIKEWEGIIEGVKERKEQIMTTDEEKRAQDLRNKCAELEEKILKTEDKLRSQGEIQAAFDAHKKFTESEARDKVIPAPDAAGVEEKRDVPVDNLYDKAMSSPNERREELEKVEAFKRMLKTGDRGIYRDLSETGQGGGAVIPITIAQPIHEAIEKMSVFRQLCRTVIFEGQIIKVPIMKEVDAKRIGRNSKLTKNTSTIFEQRDVTTEVVGVQVNVRYGELPDNAVSTVQSAMIAGLGRKSEEIFVEQLLAQVTKGTTTAETAKISYDDVVKFFMSLPFGAGNLANFILSRGFVEKIYELTDNEGRPIYNMNMQIAGNQTIFGKKWFASDFFEDAATGKVAGIYGDFTMVNIYQRGGLKFRVLNEIAAQEYADAYLGYIEAGIAMMQEDCLVKMTYK